RRAGRAPRGAGRAAGGRTADGRGEPRRPSRLHHELALRSVGRPVLPARRRLPRPARAPGPAEGRRRVVGLVLLPLTACTTPPPARSRAVCAPPGPQV